MMIRPNRRFRSSRLPTRVRGLSLVELMVALVLGLLITAGLLQLFTSSRVTFQTSDAMARVQESGRFAAELIKREFRQAGTHGFCAARIEITNHEPAGCLAIGDNFFPDTWSLTGWEFGGTGINDDYTLETDLDPGGASAGDWSSTAPSGNLPGVLSGLAAPGSDVLLVRRLEILSGITADGIQDPATNTLDLTDTHGLPDDAMVLVTNCASGVDMFQNSGDSDTFSKSAIVDWSTAYDESMQAFHVQSVAYYVGVNADGEPGLFRRVLGCGGAEDPEELVQGIESLQILYGYSDSAAAGGDGQSVDRWLRADQVPTDGWPQVVALQLGMSIRSVGVADGDPVVQTFQLANMNLESPGDGLMRHPFSTTIALRNRLIVL